MNASDRAETNGEQPARDGEGGRVAALSPTVRRVGLFLAAATVLVAVASGAVAAHDNIPQEPGASGYCDNANGDGGSFAVHFGDHENNAMDPQEAQSAAQMAAYFAQTGGECGGSDDRYLEAHVISAQQNVQYCYGERSDGDDGDQGRGDDPTDAVTAAAGAGELNANGGSRNRPPGHEENNNGEAECEYNAHNKYSIGSGNVSPSNDGAGQTTSYTASFEYDPAKNDGGGDGGSWTASAAALDLTEAVDAGGRVSGIDAGDVALNYSGDGSLEADAVETTDENDDGAAERVLVTFNQTVEPVDEDSLEMEIDGIRNPESGDYTAEIRSYESLDGPSYSTESEYTVGG
jgi:hypothetical protein